jgi:hypothetical protein
MKITNCKWDVCGDENRVGLYTNIGFLELISIHSSGLREMNPVTLEYTQPAWTIVKNSGIFYFLFECDDRDLEFHNQANLKFYIERKIEDWISNL